MNGCDNPACPEAATRRVLSERRGSEDVDYLCDGCTRLVLRDLLDDPDVGIEVQVLDPVDNDHA